MKKELPTGQPEKWRLSGVNKGRADNLEVIVYQLRREDRGH